MAYQSVNPFTNELLRTFPDHSDDQIEAIIAASYSAFQADWSRRSVAERSAVIKRAAYLLQERRDDLAKLATLEMGKLYKEAQGEVALCARILAYYADNAALFLAPRKLDVARGAAHIETAPLGPLFCIEPWNFPYYQLARVAGPNLVAGNTMIVKHAPNVPQCALAFEQLFLDAGAPVGVYSNVFASNEQSAVAIADRRIKGVALTGSERAGSAVASEAGAALKKSTMELGGSDAFIVLDDADMEVAVRLAVAGRMTNSGQVCDGAKRFIVDDSVADAFIGRFIASLQQLTPGDPMQVGTTLAPLCNEAALTNALKQVEAATQAGAHLLLGGHRLGSTGCFMEPTILTEVAPKNPAYYQEFFAPVAMIFRVKGEREAIELANDSPYGLGGTVVTKDVARGRRVATQLDTGMVFINEPAISSPELPFGGVKNSGYGRELSDLGIGEFVNRKLVRTA